MSVASWQAKEVEKVMEHKPRYNWSQLWAGMEQVHEILKLLWGLNVVGSTDPVADAAAMGSNQLLREAVAKFLLDHIVYPVAISTDRKTWLMRVRRPMNRSELLVWLGRRGFRFADSFEVRDFLEHTKFNERVYNFGEFESNGRTCKVWHLRDGTPSCGGSNIPPNIDHHEFCGHFDTFLAVLVPEGQGDRDPYPTDLNYTLEPVLEYSDIQCGRCGNHPSGWTRECPDHGADFLRLLTR